MQRKLVFLSLFLFTGNFIFPQEIVTLRKVKTGVYINPPFVMKDSTGYYTGMAIDLWKLLEDEMNFASEYIEYLSWHKMMEAVTTGEIDAAVSNISVTYERAQQVKFSFPWHDSGLRILVKSSGQGTIWNELKRNGHLRGYMWIVGIIFFLTVILTIIHRKNDPEFPRKWLNGFTESLYMLVLAIKTGVVDNRNYSWIGKVLAVVWMLTGVGLVAYVTSSITSSMTTVALSSDIHSLSDLPGKRVAVLSSTVGEEYLHNRGIPTIGYENMEEATHALINDEIDALVQDAPVLEYWVFSNPQYNLKVVGNLFHPDKYAFAANKKYNDQMDSLSVKLIKLFDLEKINTLRNNYFGNVH
ncbi:MAG: transporter substrate-binding domain-containing protein [Bacteroides sp.]|nr:transporter substrate-binding domain-containing protein [Bacteroides sp.]